MYHPHQVLCLRFKLIKRRNEFFILKTLSTLCCKDGTKIKSNYVTVVSPANRRCSDCMAPYWRV